MSSELVELAGCPLCRSVRRRHMFDVHDYGYRVSTDTYGVQRCTDCGVGFLSPRPPASDIGRFYPEDFYWIYENSVGTPLGAEDLLKRRAPQIAAKLGRLAHLKPGRMLDIGTMKGEFLHAARTKGWQVEGVEFTQQPPNLFGVPVRYGEFLDMPVEPRSLDCVTMWAVLEHVYDPQAYIEKIATSLKDGGTFIGVVTNFNTIQARLLRGDDYPRHLTLFTKNSLKQSLRVAGLELVCTWTDQDLFGGPLRGMLTYLLKRTLGYSVDEAIYEMRDYRDPMAFCAKYRGRPSFWIQNVSRVDNLVLGVVERLLDRVGNGFNLGFEARKRSA